ncbi:hypothetical protein K2X33_15550 [bacterium]|nr:hypothetical protein [bacterium]
MAARFLQLFLILTTFSHSGFADMRLFQKVSALYEASRSPSVKDMTAESLWIGRCVDKTANYAKSWGGLYLHVDSDEVLGRSFYIVPIFPIGEKPKYTEEADKALKRIDNDDVRDLLAYSKKEDAWKTVSKSLGTVLMRQGMTVDGKRTVLFSKSHDGKRFCYFADSINENVEFQPGEDPVQSPDPIIGWTPPVAGVPSNEPAPKNGAVPAPVPPKNRAGLACSGTYRYGTFLTASVSRTGRTTVRYSGKSVNCSITATSSHAGAFSCDDGHNGDVSFSQDCGTLNCMGYALTR